MPPTERLLLRRFTVDDSADLDDVAELNADPAVMRYLGDGRPMSRAQVLAEELPRLTAQYPGHLGYWALDRRAEGDFVGWCCAVPTEPRAVELGYRVRREMWGRGYASEAARAMVDLAFADPAVQRVVATTMAVNTRSRRVMEHAGLRHVRTWYADWQEPVDGHEYGDVDYALERIDWSAAADRS